MNWHDTSDVKDQGVNTSNLYVLLERERLGDVTASFNRGSGVAKYAQCCCFLMHACSLHYTLSLKLEANSSLLARFSVSDIILRYASHVSVTHTLV